MSNFNANNPEALAAAAAHQALIEQLDLHSVHKTFRNPHWRPNQRRNKNIKIILSEASRREQQKQQQQQAATTANSSAVASTPAEADSGTTSPHPAMGDDDLSTSGSSTPAANSGGGGTSNNLQPNLAQANKSLAKLVLERNMRQAGSQGAGAGAGGTGGSGAGGGVGSGGGPAGSSSSAPGPTYTNIESAASLAPLRRYCDVTGLPAPYVDPKTRMRYHNREVFAMIRGLPQSVVEQFLETRGAHTVLK